MSFDPRWAKVLGLALSLPTTILAMAWGVKELVDAGVLNWTWGIIIFLLVVGNTIVLMVLYAYRNKN